MIQSNFTLVGLSMLIIFSVTSISYANADGQIFTVDIPHGSGIPGCEETDECFFPTELRIGTGDTVTWSHDDGATHTVTSVTPTNDSDGEFDSSLFFSGNTFSHTFEDEGALAYFCLVHPWQAGMILVGDAEPDDGNDDPLTLSVAADKSSYEHGDEIVISGQVNKIVQGTRFS